MKPHHLQLTYTFDFVDARGSIDHFLLETCADHTDAVRRAEAALADSGTAIAVDVWCDTAKVARVEPPARDDAHAG